MEYFKEIEKHPFTLSHCWVKLKDYSKWQDSFAAWYKDGSKKRRGGLTLKRMVQARTVQARTSQEDTKLARPICGDKLHPLQWRTH
jgi:hypothetical protein